MLPALHIDVGNTLWYVYCSSSINSSAVVLLLHFTRLVVFAVELHSHAASNLRSAPTCSTDYLSDGKKQKLGFAALDALEKYYNTLLCIDLPLFFQYYFSKGSTYSTWLPCDPKGHLLPPGGAGVRLLLLVYFHSPVDSCGQLVRQVTTTTAVVAIRHRRSGSSDGNTNEKMS